MLDKTIYLVLGIGLVILISGFNVPNSYLHCDYEKTFIDSVSERIIYHISKKESNSKVLFISSKKSRNVFDKGFVVWENNSTVYIKKIYYKRSIRCLFSRCKIKVSRKKRIKNFEPFSYIKNNIKYFDSDSMLHKPEVFVNHISVYHVSVILSDFNYCYIVDDIIKIYNMDHPKIKLLKIIEEM